MLGFFKIIIYISETAFPGLSWIYIDVNIQRIQNQVPKLTIQVLSAAEGKLNASLIYTYINPKCH